MPKDVWRNDIERAAWVEKNCRVCFQPDEALARATGGPKVAIADEPKMVRISYGNGYVEFLPGSIPNETLYIIIEDLVAQDESSNP